MLEYTLDNSWRYEQALKPYDPNDPSALLEGLQQDFSTDSNLIELYIAGDCNDNGIMSSDDAHILLTNCGEFSPWADRLRRGGELAGSKRSLARGIGRLGIDRTCSAKSRSAATNGVIGQGDYDTLANTWGIPESQIPATYTWNDAGQCSVITPKKGDGNVKLEFGYGPDGNRTWKKVYTWNTGASAWNTTPSDHYVYVHLGPELVATLDAGNSFKVLQVYGRAGGTLLTLHEPNDPALTTDDETWYFGHDPFGNPTLLVNAATDALDLGERFDTFGRNTELVSAAGAPDQPFGFAGMQRDDETGLLLTKNGNYFNVNTGMEIGASGQSTVPRSSPTMDMVDMGSAATVNPQGPFHNNCSGDPTCTSNMFAPRGERFDECDEGGRCCNKSDCEAKLAIAMKNPRIQRMIQAARKLKHWWGMRRFGRVRCTCICAEHVLGWADPLTGDALICAKMSHTLTQAQFNAVVREEIAHQMLMCGNIHDWLWRCDGCMREEIRAKYLAGLCRTLYYCAELAWRSCERHLGCRKRSKSYYQHNPGSWWPPDTEGFQPF